MQTKSKKIEHKVNIPKPDFALGQWVDISVENPENEEAKRGYITGYVWGTAWTYWVYCPSDRSGSFSHPPIPVLRHRIRPAMDESPRFPSRA